MTPQLLDLFSRYNIALADYETAAVLRHGDYLAAGEAALAALAATARDMAAALPSTRDPFLRSLLLHHISQATNNAAPAPGWPHDSLEFGVFSFELSVSDACRDVPSVRPPHAAPDEMDASLNAMAPCRDVPSVRPPLATPDAMDAVPDAMDAVPDVMAAVGAWPATPAPGRPPASDSRLSTCAPAPGWPLASSFCNCKGASAPLPKESPLGALLAALWQRAEQFTPFDPAPWAETLAAALAEDDSSATRLAEAIAAAAPILLLGLPELAEPMRMAARLLPAPACAALLHLLTSKTRLLTLAA